MLLKPGHTINLGRQYSKSHRDNISRALKGKPRPNQMGKNHGMWMGKRLINYTSIHSYLRQFKLGKCYFCNKVGKTHLALKKDKKHERSLDNYLELCPSCHAKYDDTPEKRIKRIKALEKTYAHQNPIQNKKCKYCKFLFLPRRKSSRFCSNKCSGVNRYKNKIGLWLKLNEKK